MFKCFKKDEFYLPQVEEYEKFLEESKNGFDYVQSIFDVLKDNNYMLYSIYKQNEKTFVICIKQYDYPKINNEYFFETYELPAISCLHRQMLLHQKREEVSILLLLQRS